MAARSEPGQRWGRKTRLDDDAAREQLLDAAESCFERFGLAKTTIEDVAREAKVSRSTFYRYFEGWNDLLAAAYLRESDAVFERVGELMAKPGTFADRVVEVTMRSIAAMKRARYLPFMFSPEGIPLTSQAIAASAEFHRRARATMEPFFEAAKSSGELEPDMELDDFIEWHTRIIFSFVTVASPIVRDQASMRRLVATFVAPALIAHPRPTRTSKRK